MGRRDPDAVVDHADLGAAVLRGEREEADGRGVAVAARLGPALDGPPGVLQEVHEHALDRRGLDLDRPEVGVVALDADAGVGERVRDGPLEELVEVRRPPVAADVADVAHEAPDDPLGPAGVVADAPGVVDDRVEVLADGGGVGHAAAVEAGLERPEQVGRQLGVELGEVGDEVERVLDLVGQPGREPAERGQLLGLDELALHGPEVAERPRELLVGRAQLLRPHAGDLGLLPGPLGVGPDLEGLDPAPGLGREERLAEAEVGPEVGERRGRVAVGLAGVGEGGVGLGLARLRVHVLGDGEGLLERRAGVPGPAHGRERPPDGDEARRLRLAVADAGPEAERVAVEGERGLVVAAEVGEDAEVVERAGLGELGVLLAGEPERGLVVGPGLVEAAEVAERAAEDRVRAGLATGVVEVAKEAERGLPVLDGAVGLAELDVGVPHRRADPRLALGVPEGLGHAEVLEAEVERLVVVAEADVDRGERAERERPAGEVAERLHRRQRVREQVDGPVVVREEVPREPLVGPGERLAERVAFGEREGLLGEREHPLGPVGHVRHGLRQPVGDGAGRQRAHGEHVARGGDGREVGLGHGEAYAPPRVRLPRPLQGPRKTPRSGARGYFLNRRTIDAIWSSGSGSAADRVAAGASGVGAAGGRASPAAPPVGRGEPGLPARATSRASISSIHDPSPDGSRTERGAGAERGVEADRPRPDPRSAPTGRPASSLSGAVSNATRLRLTRCIGVTLSLVIDPPSVPGPSVIAGNSAVVMPTEPSAATVLTTIRMDGFLSANCSITRSAVAWSASVWPIPPNSSTSMHRSQPASHPSAT